jgi:hypothetical protein
MFLDTHLDIGIYNRTQSRNLVVSSPMLWICCLPSTHLSFLFISFYLTYLISHRLIFMWIILILDDPCHPQSVASGKEIWLTVGL